MPRYAIGDVQGCYVELRALLQKLRFSADRDELWFVGDLVNRGPQSLATLRFVRALGAGARVVLGNHDLHLLALAMGSRRKPRRSDTLDDVLGAADRDALCEWLLQLPLAVFDAECGDLLVHAGVVPQWDASKALALSCEVQAALQSDPRGLLDSMYGNEPSRWSEGLAGPERLRFIINAMTRLRYCDRAGTLNMQLKGAPSAGDGDWQPWFEIGARASADVRVIFGHWSALGLQQRPRLLALDSGCVWGGSLTACRLDGNGRTWSEPCAGYQDPGGD